MTPDDKLALLVLQPTPFCNIDCKYCYLPSRSDRRRMRFETLKTIASRLVDADLVGDSLSVVWHAGEPLVLSPEWYSEAIKILAEILPKPVSVEHHFQTNGLLIDDAWCDFFKRAGARVGVSIDGPQDLHDASRRTRGGKGTHAQVVRGIRQLQLAGVPLHAICVVTKAHLDHPDRLYHFFVELGIKELGFNIEEIDGINKNSTLNGDEAAAAFARFFSRIMFNYRQNPDLICIREVERVLVSLMNSAPTKLSGSVQTRPLAIVSVAWNGDISTFSPELLGISDPRLGPMSFGNVATHSFADVLADTRLQQIAVEISRGVKRCRKACPYFGFCRGGAPANKLGETGRLDTTVTMFCKLTHMVITEAVLSGLEQDLDNQARAVHPNRMRDGASGGLDTFAD
jgi:uncharacterized protein